MSIDTGRKAIRYILHIPVDVSLGRRQMRLLTEDISYQGVFLRTDTPPPLRHLLLLSISIPNQAEPLHLHAMVLHIIPPNNRGGRTPGVGCQFYAVSKNIRDKWYEYLQHVKEECIQEEPSSITVFTSTRPAETIRRRFIRFEAVLEVRIPSYDSLTSFYSKVISFGGMLLKTDIDFTEGQTLFLEIIHPETAQLFGMPCVVKRRLKERKFKGIAVEFIELAENERFEFWKFIKSAVTEDNSHPAQLVSEEEDFEYSSALSSDTKRLETEWVFDPSEKTSNLAEGEIIIEIPDNSHK